MRPLGFFSETTTGGVHETGTHITNNVKSATASLVEMWSEREIQVLILISLMLQLFMLFTGNLRRRRINWLLRFTVWLAYVGADSVAVYAIGVFSQYEDKYKLRSHSTGDILVPFLWAPFLLSHLGGQDTITAFSIDDNNLWLRHLLNLIIQVTVVLYVFWKSIDLMESKLIAIAVLIFVAGIIKYLERIWTLYQGSRDSLRKQSNKFGQGDAKWPDPSKEHISEHVMATYALQTVLCGKGLLVGRTLLQLGSEIKSKLVEGFQNFVPTKMKLKVIEMELGMMYDLLYTKAMVLQSWNRVMLRCAAQISMVVAFALFLKHAYNDSVNVVITYTLFAGAILIEACSVSMVIVSPWARAHFEKGTFLYWLSHTCVCSPFKAMQRRRQQAGFFMGQFNLTDSAYSTQKSTLLKLVSKVVRSIGLEKHWRNIWHIGHIEHIEYIERLFESTLAPFPKKIGPELRYILRLPFEHALFHLHIFTDLLISKLDDGVAADQNISGAAREFKMLSDYMMYLMAVHPSMLPVSTAAQGIEVEFAEWVRGNCGTETTKLQLLENYVITERHSESPFKTSSPPSLEEIKEVWIRLLVYAAGKCPGEEHARQLGNGGEVLTYVWTLMMHRDVGGVGRELNLLTSHDADHVVHEAQRGSNWVASKGAQEGTTLVSADQSNWVAQEGPLYAFEFISEVPQIQTATGTQETVVAGSAMEMDEPGTAMEIDQRTIPGRRYLKRTRRN